MELRSFGFGAIFCLSIAVPGLACAQIVEEINFSAVITDEKSFPVSGARIKNLRTNTLTNADNSGYFDIPCSSGDSLMIMAFGYELRIVTADEELPSVIRLHTIQFQLQEITIYDFKSWDHFKREFLDLDIEERKVNTTGLPARSASKIPVHLRSNTFAAAPNIYQVMKSPISALAYAVNKKEREKRAMLHILNEEAKRGLYWSLMNVDSLAVITPIPDSLMDDFIIYCNDRIENKSLDKVFYYLELIHMLEGEFLENNRRKNEDRQP